MSTNVDNEFFDLFSGVAVVIDDKIDTEVEIKSIVEQLEAQNIPVLKYDKLPEADLYKNFHNISFILLDWKLVEGITYSDRLGGVTTPSDTEKAYVQDNIEFLQNLQKICFAPIFIFTNEQPDGVIEVLKENKLYNDEPPNYIFVESKQSLKNNKVIKTISNWIEKNPPVYVLKKWEKHFRDAKNKTFFNLYDISPSWPKILWKAFENDSGNPNVELRETISQNINSVMDSLKFNEKCIKNNARKEPASIIGVLDGAKFIENKYLDPSSVRSGDLFFVHPDDGSDAHYLLNIRADCDLIDRKSNDNNNVTLYCIFGHAIDYDSTQDKDNNGYINEKVHNAIVYALDENKIVEFCFKDLTSVKYNDIKDSRRGRLLHPYISRIQQRFAFYIHRHGTPRPPVSFLKQ